MDSGGAAVDGCVGCAVGAAVLAVGSVDGMGNGVLAGVAELPQAIATRVITADISPRARKLGIC